MNLLENARKAAAQVVQAAYEKAVAAGTLPQAELPPVAVEIPKDASNGFNLCHAVRKAAAHGTAQDCRGNCGQSFAGRHLF